MEFTVKVPEGELQKALKQISAWDGKTVLRVENALRRGTQAIAREARHRVPVHTVTLKKGIKSGFSAVRCEGRVYTNVPYGHLVEFGTRRSYIVRPVKKKALTIPWYRGSGFAMKAEIPVRKGHPFLKPAYDYESPKIVSEVKKVLKEK